MPVIEISHETLAYAAKSWGLFYLIGLSLCVLVYAYWPRNKDTFDRASKRILEEDDKPCP